MGDPHGQGCVRPRGDGVRHRAQRAHAARVADDPGADVLQHGAVVFGYDGSPAAVRAIRLTAPILAARHGLVVTVWEPGVAYEAFAPSIVPAPIDIRTAMEIDQALYEAARRTAEQGAAIARELGLDALGLAVVDVLTPARTLVRLAEELAAPAVVVGDHGHRAVRELLLGSTTRDVVRTAPCPVCVVRDRSEPTESARHDQDT